MQPPLKPFLMDPLEFFDGSFGILDRDRREAVQPAVGRVRVVVQPVVVVLLARHQEFRILEAEQSEEAGVQELGVDAVFVLVLMPVGAVANARGQAVVALRQDALRLVVAHVVHFRFVARASLSVRPSRLRMPAKPMRRRTPARTLGRDDDAVVHRAGPHDPWCVVAEALGQTDETSSLSRRVNRRKSVSRQPSDIPLPDK